MVDFRRCSLVKEGSQNYSVTLHGVLAMETFIMLKEPAGKWVTPLCECSDSKEGESDTQVSGPNLVS